MKSTTVLTLLALTSLTACAPNGLVQVQTTPDTFCLVAKPIYFDMADRMTERTERAIIAHNEKGEKLCKWSGAQ